MKPCENDGRIFRNLSGVSFSGENLSGVSFSGSKHSQPILGPSFFEWAFQGRPKVTLIQP